MYTIWKHPILNKTISNVDKDFFPKGRGKRNWVTICGIPFYLIKRAPDGKTTKWYQAYNSITRNYVDYGETVEELIEKLHKHYPSKISLDLTEAEFKNYIVERRLSKKDKIKEGK